MQDHGSRTRHRTSAPFLSEVFLSLHHGAAFSQRRCLLIRPLSPSQRPLRPLFATASPSCSLRCAVPSASSGLPRLRLSQERCDRSWLAMSIPLPRWWCRLSDKTKFAGALFLPFGWLIAPIKEGCLSPQSQGVDLMPSLASPLNTARSSSREEVNGCSTRVRRFQKPTPQT